MKNPDQQIYPYCIELHAHTHPVSPCGNFSAEDTVRMYKERGADGLVITNHFYPTPYNGLAERAAIDKYLDDLRRAKEMGEKLQIKVYMGMEIRFAENSNDYLLYGVTEADMPFLLDCMLHQDIAEFSRTFRRDDRLLIFAHPMRNGIADVDLSLFDGVEVFNMHPGHNSRVSLVARRVSEHPDLLVTGGSDFHHLDHDGTCLLRARSLPADEKELVRILRSRDYRLSLSGYMITPYL